MDTTIQIMNCSAHALSRTVRCERSRFALIDAWKIETAPHRLQISLWCVLWKSSRQFWSIDPSEWHTVSAFIYDETSWIHYLMCRDWCVCVCVYLFSVLNHHKGCHLTSRSRSRSKYKPSDLQSASTMLARALALALEYHCNKSVENIQ